jgi:hypothetical protein
MGSSMSCRWCRDSDRDVCFTCAMKVHKTTETLLFEFYKLQTDRSLGKDLQKSVERVRNAHEAWLNAGAEDLPDYLKYKIVSAEDLASLLIRWNVCSEAIEWVKKQRFSPVSDVWKICPHDHYIHYLVSRLAYMRGGDQLRKAWGNYMNHPKVRNDLKNKVPYAMVERAVIREIERQRRNF